MPCSIAASSPPPRAAGPFRHQPVETEPRVLLCPHCGKVTPHRIYRSLEHLIFWCQSCYVVRSDRPVAVPADLG